MSYKKQYQPYVFSLALILCLNFLFAGNASAHAPAHVIRITNAGYLPTSLVIEKGEKILFENKSNKTYWPQVVFQPLPKGNVRHESPQALKPQETWLYKFDLIGTWYYHDKLNSKINGVVHVENKVNHPISKINPQESKTSGNFLINIVRRVLAFFGLVH